ncbi:MAG: hypothetical protein IPP16_12475 [Acidimicrobiaceae bacterium]|nr:hypothetical protein [Acidimicrobiaceae bacterium]
MIGLSFFASEHSTVTMIVTAAGHVVMDGIMEEAAHPMTRKLTDQEKAARGARPPHATELPAARDGPSGRQRALHANRSVVQSEER